MALSKFPAGPCALRPFPARISRRFLHLRAACDDFMAMMKECEGDFCGGVVHSFDGTREELGKVLELEKLSIGINVSLCCCDTYPPVLPYIVSSMLL